MTIQEILSTEKLDKEILIKFLKQQQGKLEKLLNTHLEEGEADLIADLGLGRQHRFISNVLEKDNPTLYFDYLVHDIKQQLKIENDENKISMFDDVISQIETKIISAK